MKILYRGAESIIYSDRLEGKNVVVKERIEKSYRIKELDLKLRRNRTKREIRLLTEARKVGVPTPKILDVDLEKCKIVMEDLGEERIKEVLEKSDEETIKKICLEVGRLIGKLHSAGIIHGDLTTSNLIFKDGKIYFIDFGLGNFSNRIEDKGVDLNLLYEALKSTHFKILNLCWENIVKGYEKEYKDGKKVLERVKEIESRARYAKREG